MKWPFLKKGEEKWFLSENTNQSVGLLSGFAQKIYLLLSKPDLAALPHPALPVITSMFPLIANQA